MFFLINNKKNSTTFRKPESRNKHAAHGFQLSNKVKYDPVKWQISVVWITLFFFYFAPGRLTTY